MAKHEPWYKPRDEDADDQLLDWLGGRKNPPPKYGGLGCPLTAAPAVGVIVVLLMAVTR